NNDWWDRTDNKAAEGWNGTDNKAGGDQGWNYYVDDYNNYYPSYGNKNNNYYPSYGNVNNETYEADKVWTWRNNGIRSKSSGQGYGHQRAHGSTMQAHGGQGIHVHH
nr:hypothetical protein [Tanacetum cinerariifolium]